MNRINIKDLSLVELREMTLGEISTAGISSRAYWKKCGAIYPISADKQKCGACDSVGSKATDFGLDDKGNFHKNCMQCRVDHGRSYRMIQRLKREKKNREKTQ